MRKSFKQYLVTTGVVLMVGSIIASYTLREGRLHVVGIDDAQVEVTLDGKLLVKQGGRGNHHSFIVPRGEHTAVVTEKSTGRSITYAVNILRVGKTEVVLPVRPDQCFVRFDVTHAAYSVSGSAPREYPRIEQRYADASGPIRVPSNTYFSLDELPPNRRGSEDIYLLRHLPCRFVDMPSPFSSLSEDSATWYTRTATPTP